MSYYAPGGLGVIPSTDYGNNSPANLAYREQVALDRENRLNAEEQRAYDDSLCECIYGPGFFRRAHP